MLPFRHGKFGTAVKSGCSFLSKKMDSKGNLWYNSYVYGLNQPRKEGVPGLENAKRKNSAAGRTLFRVIRGFVTAIAAAGALALTLPMLLSVATGTGISDDGSTVTSKASVMDRYDAYVTNSISDALDGVITIQKEYWLSDADNVAPKPDPECYGETDDPSSLQWLLDEAERLLGITDTLFSTDVEIKPGSTVNWYLDETIFVICWKEVIDDSVYSMSEVKIAHASQFRRFLADGTYGSDKQYYTTEMATTVNAVAACSGDFYKYRWTGVVVYNGIMYRSGLDIDCCYIDENGDLLFTKGYELKSTAEAQQFVDDNNVRFSLAFGPIMVRDGVNVTPDTYGYGQPEGNYSRAVLGQLGERHYLMVTVNYDGYYSLPTTSQVADHLIAFGVTQAYSLDGGQTATLVLNNQLFNAPDYGSQRQISDIIYFATAIPSDE